MNIEKIMGWTFLIISIFGFLTLIMYMFFANYLSDNIWYKFYYIWVGVHNRDSNTISTVPFYFGLVAIAGAYLVKKEKNNK